MSPLPQAHASRFSILRFHTHAAVQASLSAYYTKLSGRRGRFTKIFICRTNSQCSIRSCSASARIITLNFVLVRTSADLVCWIFSMNDTASAFSSSATFSNRAFVRFVNVYRATLDEALKVVGVCRNRFHGRYYRTIPKELLALILSIRARLAGTLPHDDSETRYLAHAENQRTALRRKLGTPPLVRKRKPGRVKLKR